MAEEKTPQEIEREIEVEREQLASSLDALTDKFSVDNMVRTVSDQASQHGGEVATNLMRTVKSNPAAAVLAGVGIAWLIASSSRQQGDVRYVEGRDTRRIGTGEPGPYVRSDYYRRSEYAGTATNRDADGDGDSSPDGEPGGLTPAPAYDTGSRPTARGFADTYPADDFTRRVSSAEARMQARNRSAEDWSDDDDEDQGFFARAGERAGGIWERATSSVRSGAAGLRTRAVDLRDSIMEGTEGMDDQGQSRVAQARARAYAAQARAEEMGRRGRAQASGFFYEQPLVTGALAVAVGAAVGAMLPRTQREDEAFGAYRDSLFDEAENVFHQERARAEAAASAALREAKQVAMETKDKVLGDVDGKETVQQAEAGARSAAQRIGDAAKEGAEKAS